MCMLCGDPYSLEFVLGPLLTQTNCYLSRGDRSIAIETHLGDTKRKVEVVLSSYHGAADFKDELVHGFILVYSTKRRASLRSLSALSVDIPELPLQILAVTENNGAAGSLSNTYQNTQDALASSLLVEGSNLADRLNAHFTTSSDSLQQKGITNLLFIWINFNFVILILQPPFTPRFLKRLLKRKGKLNKLWTTLHVSMIREKAL